MTFQDTGIKLKLLNSSFTGDPVHVLVNHKMVNNTGLERLCIIEDNPNATKRIITDLMQMEFTEHEIEKRKKILDKDFSNNIQATKIAKEIFTGSREMFRTEARRNTENKGGPVKMRKPVETQYFASVDLKNDSPKC